MKGMKAAWGVLADNFRIIFHIYPPPKLRGHMVMVSVHPLVHVFTYLIANDIIK